MSPKGDTRLAKIGKYLMSDVPKSKLAIITASVAVVCAVFKIKFVEEKISGIAEWLDQNIPHGKWREATGNAFQIVGTIAGWELVLGWEVMKETTGMNGVNPFRDQFDFLRENLGQEGVDAWNKKVSDVQNGGMAEQVFGIKN